jgi:uncharacterized membrane protein SpoIIM required for sporulation
LAIDIEQFLERGGPRWQRLGALLDQGDDSDTVLGIARLEELLSLYRQACADLNLARGLTRNARLLEPLNQIVGRAYRFIYGGRRRTKLPPGYLRRLLFTEIPQTFQRESRSVLLAALALIVGAVVGAGATIVEPDTGAALIPAQFFSESPGERVRQIEHGHERIDNVERATTFGATLYTHNIQVSFLGFALGALTIVGGLWLAFFNGVLLGAIAVRYLADGVGTFFIAWVGPHGSLELPAIVFATAAGVRMGQAFLLPGERGRKASVREAMQSVWRMLLTTAILLVFAGTVEGSFSQLSSNSVSYAVKICVALVLFSGMIFWLFGSAPRPLAQPPASSGDK